MDAQLRSVVYRQILERVYTMKAAPVWDRLPQDQKDAFDQRMTADELTWDQVSDDDKQLIRRGEFEVSAGLGRLQSIAERGDWSAIDAAIDSEDDAQLDAALFTVGHGWPKETWMGGADSLEALKIIKDPAYTDSSGDDVDPDDVPADGETEGWVGV